MIDLARIVLLNPNTTAALTDLMVEIAREVAPADLSVEGLTAPFGPPLITCELELEAAARAVLSLAPVLAQRADAVIVAAFGDPAADALATMLAKPVIGIAEAAMRIAASGGRRFVVITHTGQLVARMARRAREIGLGANCVGVLATEGDPATLMANAAALESALKMLAHRGVEELGAEAVIVGGGPLGGVAKRLRGRVGVPVIEAIPAAVHHVAAALGRPVTR